MTFVHLQTPKHAILVSNVRIHQLKKRVGELPTTMKNGALKRPTNSVIRAPLILNANLRANSLIVDVFEGAC